MNQDLELVPSHFQVALKEQPPSLKFPPPLPADRTDAPDSEDEDDDDDNVIDSQPQQPPQPSPQSPSMSSGPIASCPLSSSLLQFSAATFYPLHPHHHSPSSLDQVSFTSDPAQKFLPPSFTSTMPIELTRASLGSLLLAQPTHFQPLEQHLFNLDCEFDNSLLLEQLGAKGDEEEDERSSFASSTLGDDDDEEEFSASPPNSHHYSSDDPMLGFLDPEPWNCLS